MEEKVSRKETLTVPQEEIDKQKEFIRLVNNINSCKLKKCNVQTFGCQMNENDSERLSGMLLEMRYIETDDIKESDIIIYNTCCVRENAELKVYGHLGALKKVKMEKPELIISVCGCMMQQPTIVEQIKKKYRHVDLVFGTHNLYKFPELLYNTIKSNKTVISVWESIGQIAEGMPIKRKEGIKSLVTAMYGCNNFCSYCIVPYVRGRERSRNVEDVVNEVKTLAQHDCKEVTILGQNVNSYGLDLRDGSSFAKLLYTINDIKGIQRIRFMTSHPKDLSDELIKAVKELDKVCEHLHLPIQSGSTRILSEMNRKYSKENYLELVKNIRETIPQIALTTDIIVGFPGETEEDFDETIDLMERVRFDSAYTFLYSKRTGTPAALSNEQISAEVKKKRFAKLVEVQNRISKELNNKLLGAQVEVLVEGMSKSSQSTLTGRTRANKIVNFKGNKALIGELVSVRIDKIHTWSLEGELVEST